MKKINLIIALLAVVGLPIIFNPWGFEFFSMPKFLLLLLIAWMAAWAVTVFRTEKTRVQLREPWVAAGVLILLASISGLSFSTSLFGAEDHHEGILTYAAYASLFFLGLKLHNKAGLILKTAVWVGFGLSILGLLQFSGIGVLPYGEAFGQGRIFALAGNPIIFAIYMLMMAPIALYLALSEDSKSASSKIYLIAYGCMIMAGILTQSRGAWLAIPVSAIPLIVLFAGKHSLGKKWIVVAGVVLMAVLLLGNPQSMISKVSDAAKQRDPSVKTRVLVWQGSLNFIEAQPLLGTGPDNFVRIFGKYTPQSFSRTTEDMFIFDRPHNFLLELATSLGLVGMTAVLWLFLSALWTLLKRKNIERAESGISLAPFMLSGALGLAVSMQTSFTNPEIMGLWWLLSGVSLAKPAASVKTAQKESPEWHIPAFAAVTLLGVLLLLPLFTADLYAGRGMKAAYPANVQLLERAAAIKADYPYLLNAGSLNFKQALEARDTQALEKGIEVLKVAYEKYPGLPEAPRLLGQSYLLKYDLTGIDQLNEAVMWYERTLKILPVWARGHVELATVYLRKKDIKMAERHALRAVKMNGKTAFAYTVLGESLEKGGKKEQAISAYRTAVMLDPTFTDIKLKLQTLESP